MSYLDPDPHAPLDTCDCHDCAIHERNTLRTRAETMESVIRAILNSVPFSLVHAPLARRARLAIAAPPLRLTTDTPAPALPKWPKEPKGPITDGIWHEYDRRRYVAALARMEALAAFVEANRHAIRAPMTVDERRTMDELLAACERRSGG